MSHRVTTKTVMTERIFAEQAAAALGWGFNSAVNGIDFTTGPFRRGRLTLTTGDLAGDSDYCSDSDRRLFCRKYSEMAVRHNIAQNGHIVESCVEQGNTIRIIASGGF